VGAVPFNYLGLPVGANVRRTSTWEPLLATLRHRLGSWGNKFVSLGGRIVLLNTVLNAIPIFYLSFFKIPILVWKKVRRIQREFLWCGKSGRTRISWVKWDTVCKPKKLGGLGVRDIRAVNISLLSKWRWRLLDNEYAMWKEVLKSKYGENATGRVCISDDCRPWFSSGWWNDICFIGTNVNSDWFSQGVIKNVGRGNQTRFWHDTWVGNVSLQARFPRLYSISTQKDSVVADLRVSEDGGVLWNLVWRRRLFVWEETLVTELLEIINPVVFSEESDT
jgi:hypothetical protein